MMTSASFVACLLRLSLICSLTATLATSFLRRLASGCSGVILGNPSVDFGSGQTNVEVRMVSLLSSKNFLLPVLLLVCIMCGSAGTRCYGNIIFQLFNLSSKSSEVK
jgi:hypothetical protein